MPVLGVDAEKETGGGLVGVKPAVSTATLVEPTTVPSLSANCTNIRSAPGSGATLPVPVTKIPNVAVAFASIPKAMVVDGVSRQTLLVGSVWQIATETGSVSAPVLVVTVTLSEAPRLAVATENAPEAAAPASATVPFPPAVAASAMTSGVGEDEAVSNSVLIPDRVGAGSSPSHVNLNATLVVGNAADDVSAITKVWKPPAGIVTGVSTVPVSSFVVGSVV